MILRDLSTQIALKGVSTNADANTDPSDNPYYPECGPELMWYEIIVDCVDTFRTFGRKIT